MYRVSVDQLTALEAHFVPFEASGDSFFRGVHGLAAFGTLGVFYWFERHFVCAGNRNETFVNKNPYVK